MKDNRAFSFVNLMLEGNTRWADSESSILRWCYVFSHPVMIAFLLLAGIVLTDAGDLLFGIPIVQNYLKAIDQLSDIPKSYSALAIHKHRVHLFFSILLLAIPVVLPILVSRLVRSEKKYWQRIWEVKSTSWLVGMLFIVPLLPLVTVFGLLIPGDPSFCKGCTTGSLLGLYFIYAICAPIGIALTTAGTVHFWFFVGRRLISNFILRGK